MNEEDRKAFESSFAIELNLVKRTKSLHRHYESMDTNLAWLAWKRSRDHYRQQVQELVEAVEKAERTASCTTDLANVEVDSDDWDVISRFAAKLKEQHDG